MGPTPVATIQSANTFLSLSLNVWDFGCIVITGEATERYQCVKYYYIYA